MLRPTRTHTMLSRALFTGFVAVATGAAVTAPDPVSPATWEATFNTDLPADPVTGAPADPIVIKVTRSLAPLGSDRFFALVKAGFYNNSAFFRVVPSFVIQFGISGDAALNKEWLNNPIKDDAVVGSNTAGTVSFADAGPNTRSSQVFINLGDNSRLDKMGFSVFGEVTQCCDELNTITNPTPGNSGGVDQGEYEQKGNDWIRKTYPGINFITTAVVSSEAESPLAQQ
mmetsp:Transcript_19304/g.50184  ORF Transcript_19304/g.50184 Transcript_19304/m.50184 type:complete len:228 (-) Transcript_19304:121-804(-)